MERVLRFGLFLIWLLPLSAGAGQLPWQTDQHVRYLALGDSLAAGYGAVPTTQGYTYLLYQGAVFAPIPQLLFADAAVPGVTSAEVLQYQVPQAIVFRPDVITLSVGGNDLLGLLGSQLPTPAQVQQVVQAFAANLSQILARLRTQLPNARIYINNLYTVPEIPGADQIVPLFNQTLFEVAQAYEVPVADVYDAFLGRSGLLLIERHGAGPYQVHPTNAGYRVMAQAYAAVIQP